MLDLVLRGGRVCDGSGGAAHDADVGVEAGRIVAIGRLDGAAPRPLDLGGRRARLRRRAYALRCAGALGSPLHAVVPRSRPRPSPCRPEEAVRRLTAMPAAIYGIPERGLLAPGRVATSSASIRRGSRRAR